jgi:hypothetical protein
VTFPFSLTVAFTNAHDNRYAPIAAVGVANLYVFYRVWQAIAAVPKSRRRNPLQSWRKRVQSDAFKSVSLFALLGSTWLVGLLFLTGDRVFWECVFPPPFVTSDVVCVCVCVCVLSHWVHAVIVEMPDLPFLKRSSH